MATDENLKYSYFFFVSSLVFAGFLLYVLIYGSGVSRVIGAFLFCGMIYIQLKTALLLYRSAKRKD
jgi:hypothetical protein